jgi:hypothetical protein
MPNRARYQAYLVRLWPTQRAGVADYRVTVQSVVTGERQHFADLASLVAFWRSAKPAQDAEDVEDDEPAPGEGQD